MPHSSPSNRTDLIEFLRERALFVRLEAMKLIAIAKNGHYTSTFSCAELLATLYYHVLNIRPSEPQWTDRDRFVMSKGHAAVGLYPILADLGYFPWEWLKDYSRLGSAFADHPDMTRIPGADFSSGSLGHGLSACVGMALAGRIDKRDYRTFCMMGDGELHEGQIWAAAMTAGHYGLGNLVGIVDRNRMCLDGFIEEVIVVEPLNEKFEAFGWDVRVIDGHDLEQLVDTFDSLPPPSHNRPVCIIANTVKGKGLSLMEFSRAWHVGYLAGQDYEDAVQEIIANSGVRTKVGAAR